MTKEEIFALIDNPENKLEKIESPRQKFQYVLTTESGMAYFFTLDIKAANKYTAADKNGDLDMSAEDISDIVSHARNVHLIRAREEKFRNKQHGSRLLNESSLHLLKSRYRE